MFRNYYTKQDMLRDFSPDTEIILFDTETNGRPDCEEQGDPPNKDLRVIELAALKLKVDENNIPQIIDELHFYMKPHIPVSEKIEELTGITNEFLSSCHSEKDYKDKIYNFFGSEPIIAAYNAPFDKWFIERLYERLGLPTFNPEKVIDILKMSKTLLSGTVGSYNEKGYWRYNLKLGTCVHYFGLDKDIQFHSALDDTKATWLLVVQYIEMYKALSDNFFTVEKNKLVVNRVSYWEKEFEEGRVLKRIYVDFIGNGKCYFGIGRNEWVAERFRFCDFDMKNFEEQVFQLTGISSYKELENWKGNVKR